MWALVGGWVRTLIVIVLLGNLAELVLPKGDLRRYAGLVVGLVLLLVMIRPLLSLVDLVNREPAATPFNWVSSGPSLDDAITIEEQHQAEAMMETIPGVVTCQIVMLSNTDVAISTLVEGKVSRPLLKRMGLEAVSLIMGQGVHVASLNIVTRSRTSRA
jgi:stage III sporulation protein AF